ncbi:MAG: type II toxin-antitoxin system Phd/YefM family antitoxin [Lentisphaerae bacterium]|nr:type II toxin-antitoxin system Phd/YefM family antitoxin [Lentisphaerota bacterium]
MDATVVDLRYHMNDVLKALARNESVNVLCRGQVKGVLRPAARTSSSRVKDHAFFASRPAGEPVERVMEGLRGGRCRDL